MARIPESFIQDLLNRVDIVDVIERYLPLKKAGQNYAACCPFHKEKSPSFTVSPTKQFYHCFGCGAHGSAVGFVMEYEALSYPEAIRKLAESVGLQVPQEAVGMPQAPKAEPGLFDVLKAASDFYRQQLKGAPQAIAYLKGRGLEGRTAARYGLGYAPGGDDWQALKQVFPDYDWNALLAEAGLVVDKEVTRRRYDRFRDRVMFPILNQRGAVIGFGGRVMGQGEPKYLNSPETPVFEKGRELYGLAQARAAIRDVGRVLVVEGYMDVVMLAQHGVEYAVATLGTACTPEHVRKLLKLADDVVFCFDGDKAGRRAAWRALENSLDLLADGKKLTFLFLPEEHDPDSYVRAFGRERFEQCVVQDAVPLAQFLLRELASQVELESDEGRARLIHLASPLLARVKAPAYALMLKKRLGQLCRLELSELDSILDGQAPAVARGQSERRGHGEPTRQRQEYRSGRAAVPSVSGRNRQDLVERLLQLTLADPALARQAEPVWLGWAAHGKVKLACAVLSAAREYGQFETGMQLVELWRGEAEFEQLLALSAQASNLFGRGQADPEGLQKEFAESLAVIGQSLALPTTLDRKAELEYRAVHGGLTEHEKQEYIALVAAEQQQKRQKFQG
ncbi:DNA primase [Chitiniphilus purpureus]|uniref:DNA primase n=1 Tax=Chitiniphilus purpureus TaxID=2981137 RepID=A0ABY6DUT4_9NEIS|nr:DNA primase [Chitiniphilus sp. CD1]UXY16821.1 DNA primase [Chitiniphilus sp. CD1]